MKIDSRFVDEQDLHLLIPVIPDHARWSVKISDELTRNVKWSGCAGPRMRQVESGP
jgi:hypothetical protein